MRHLELDSHHQPTIEDEDTGDADITGQVQVMREGARAAVDEALAAMEATDARAAELEHKIHAFRAAAHKPTTRILVVDDNAVVGFTIKRMLTVLGVVDVATDGRDAITKVRGHHYGLAVVDLDLGPGMTGLDVIEAIRRETRPPVPAILISGVIPNPRSDGSDELDDLCNLCGAQGWIRKPWKDNRELVELARRVMRPTAARA